MLGQTRLHPRLCNFYEHTVQENEKQKEKTPYSVTELHLPIFPVPGNNANINVSVTQSPCLMYTIHVLKKKS